MGTEFRREERISYVVNYITSALGWDSNTSSIHFTVGTDACRIKKKTHPVKITGLFLRVRMQPFYLVALRLKERINA